MRLDNAHIGDTGMPQPLPSPAPEFETRASVNINYRLGASGSQYNSDYYFIEQERSLIAGFDSARAVKL